METFIVCAIVVVLVILFAIICCKLSSKLELKSQYEKPVPDNLQPATREEKELLCSYFTMVGTVYGGNYTKALTEKWCKSLYVAYGIIVSTRDSITIGDGMNNIVRFATIKIDDLEFEIVLDNAILNDKVIVFYSKDNNGRIVYRFTMIRKNM